MLIDETLISEDASNLAQRSFQKIKSIKFLIGA